MRKPLQQVALFCDAAQSTSSKGINWLWWILWALTVIIPPPPWCGGWRRLRMLFLMLPERNRCKSLFSRVTVKTVHLCYCFAEVWSEFHRCISARCVQRDRPGFLISLILLGRLLISEIFLRHLVHLEAFCFSPINFELRVTNLLNLSDCDREFLQHPFWYISFLNYGRWSAPSVLQFYHAKHHEVAPSWWLSSGWWTCRLDLFSLWRYP